MSKTRGVDHPGQRKLAGITTFTASAIAVADMVGIGVFPSLGFQVSDITSVFSVILLWIVGGVVALCGALLIPACSAVRPACRQNKRPKQM